MPLRVGRYIKERRETPLASSKEVRRRMQATRQAGTEAELRLCEELTRSGLHYETNQSVLPGMRCRADILFPSAQVAVFVDGCFWHCCPVHGTVPKSNRAWWMAKLRANRERDVRTNRLLRKAGWTVLRVWEHVALESPESATRNIAKQVGRTLAKQTSPRGAFKKK